MGAAKEFVLPPGVVDFFAEGKAENELFRIYDADGRTAHVFYASFFGGKGKKAPSLKEANKHYRERNGADFIVDGSTVDLNNIDTSGWEIEGQYTISTLLTSKQGRVFGQLEVIYKGNNQVQILENMYDFDIKPIGSVCPCCIASKYKTIGRNIATWIGDINAGKGTPFMFKFIGLTTIKYPAPIINTWSQTSHGFRFK